MNFEAPDVYRDPLKHSQYCSRGGRRLLHNLKRTAQPPTPHGFRAYEVDTEGCGTREMSADDTGWGCDFSIFSVNFREKKGSVLWICTYVNATMYETPFFSKSSHTFPLMSPGVVSCFMNLEAPDVCRDPLQHSQYCSPVGVGCCTTSNDSNERQHVHLKLEKLQNKSQKLGHTVFGSFSGLATKSGPQANNSHRHLTGSAPTYIVIILVGCGTREMSADNIGCTKNPIFFQKVITYLPRASLRVFIRNYVDKENRDLITQLAEKTRIALHTLVQNSTWLKAESKQLALDKINAMGKMIGYPDFFEPPGTLDGMFKNVSSENLCLIYLIFLAKSRLI